MTKKDYELIAEVFARSYHRHPCWNAMRDEIANELADALAKDNTRFSKPRFLSACGIEQENICPKWHDEILPDKDGNCSLCGQLHKGMIKEIKCFWCNKEKATIKDWREIDGTTASYPSCKKCYNLPTEEILKKN